MLRYVSTRLALTLAIVGFAWFGGPTGLPLADEGPAVGAVAEPGAAPAGPEKRRKGRRGRSRDEDLREIRVAVLPIGATDDVKVDPEALTDQVHVLMSILPQVTMVDRDQVNKVVSEHEMALSGLVDLNQSVQLGKMLSAEYILVGRASMIGDNYYLVLKMIDVETTKQKTIAAKAPAESDEERSISALIENLEKVLAKEVRPLQTTPLDSETLAKVEELRELLAPFRGMRFLVDVPESHVTRQVPDPAAQMMITHFLSRLDIEFVVPKASSSSWKERVLETGTFDKQKIDYLLEGEGVSEFAGRIQGLVSCRARVELRLIETPGRSVVAIERGVGAGVDLTESLSSKMALEKAGIQAVEALMRRAAEKPPTQNAAPDEPTREKKGRRKAAAAR